MTDKPRPTFSFGDQVHVILNDRNRTSRCGQIRDIIWHHKDQKYNYYISEDGKKISKRYYEEDLEILPPTTAISKTESLMLPTGLLRKQVDEHPYPLVFATISGAHLYGFPSADSDFDLRGVHLLPLEQVVGLDPGEETVEKDGIHDGIEMDLVTHDAKKFFGLMLKKNGYVLEQLLSPLVVHTTPEHEQLKAIAKDCITRHHSHHYLGFAATQWKLFRKEDPPKVKPLLYVYRVLLTGIHLMKTGEVEANLLTLNETAKLPYIKDLVERKLSGPEKGRLEAADMEFHEREYERLVADLESAAEKSTLPERASGKDALNDLLVTLRKGATVQWGNKGVGETKGNKEQREIKGEIKGD